MVYVIIPFLLLLLSQDCYADQIIVTQDGKKVLLKDSGTWSYYDESSEDPQPSAEASPDPDEQEISLSPESSYTPLSDDAESLQKTLPDSGKKDTSTFLESTYTSLFPGSTPPGRELMLLYIVIIIAAVLFFIVVGILLYFLILQPGKKRKALVQALNIIKDEKSSEFREAEKLLDKAINSGLKKRELPEAYFARAYVKVRLDKFDEAFADLQKTDSEEPEVVYLDLWLKVKLKKYKEAYEIYERYGDKVEDMLDAKELVSIACLHLGKEHWRDRKIDAAIPYFEQVRNLGVHTDLIPQNISSHQITLGILALFDKHFDEAEEYFENAKEQAEKENTSNIEAELGILLCEWRKEDYPDIDNALKEVIELLEKTSEDKFLKRNFYLWFAISRIFTWFQRKENSGLPDKEREILRSRLDKVSDIAPDMGDPSFIIGLIDYYFAYDTQREEAVENIEKSKIKVPEAEILVKKEKKLLEYERKSLDRFYALAKKYLSDRTVPRELRNELKERFEGFSRFKELANEITIDDTDEEVVASLKDIQNRGELLRKRVKTIIQPKLPKDAPEKKTFDTLMKDMDETTKSIAENTKQLEKSEQQLMINTGEFLLSEEEMAELEHDKEKVRTLRAI